MDKRMQGPRRWRFTAGSAVASGADTDFWLEYTARARDDGATQLGIVLREAWEHVDFDTAAGMARRRAIEDRCAALVHGFVGRKGTLEIDYSLTGAKSFSGVELRSLTPGTMDLNTFLSYDLEFVYPIGRAGILIARALHFNGNEFTAENFLVEYAREDRTTFKDVFRAAPIRVADGPSIKTIRITAIRQAVTGLTDVLPTEP